MSKNPKFTIKNVQIAGAVNLEGLKAKLSKKVPHDEAEAEAKEAAKQTEKPKSKPRKVHAAEEIAHDVEADAEKKKRATKAKEEQAEEGAKEEQPKKRGVRATAPKVKREAEEESVSKTPLEEPVKAHPVIQERVPVQEEVQKEPVKEPVLEARIAAKAPEPREARPVAPSSQEGRRSDVRPAASPAASAPMAPLPRRYEGTPQPRQYHTPQSERPGQGGFSQRRPPETGHGSRGYMQPFHRPAQDRASNERPSGGAPTYQPRPFQERPPAERGGESSYQGRREQRPYPPRQYHTPGGAQGGSGHGGQGQGGSGYGGSGYGSHGSGPRRSDERRPFTPRPFTPHGPGSRPGAGGGFGAGAGPRPHGPASAGRAPFGGSIEKGPAKEVPPKERTPERTGKFEQRKGVEIDFRQQKKGKEQKRDDKPYDARVRHGLVSVDEGEMWRKRRHTKQAAVEHHEIVRPSKVKVRLPISIKDLAVEMKLKSSELIAKLFLQGIVVTLNDTLDDETVVQLLGHDFGCEISIDTAEQERIQITDKTAREEIKQEAEDSLSFRPPVVAFMGHVDHGKTSLIDAIRKSNRAAKEVGAITQHIGAFQCQTSHGSITILDTPGHEAFTLMRERGAEITDIVVLVIAGDEGIQEQTLEALEQARKASATIVVAITKSDKPNFNADNVMRQMADRELLPEAWGGQTVTVPCSAVSGSGVNELLEMLALQAEVLELKANPAKRARGVVIESEVIQGLGDCATVLVQNGTLREGDALVFSSTWAKIKSMRDEHGKIVKEAVPSQPVLINGMSGLPEAGDEFIVVKNDKEAREIAEKRHEGKRESLFMAKKRVSFENMMQGQVAKKVLKIILRADVQGSLEALRKALEKIKSDKVEVEFISHGVGQISESDVQLAQASKAVILGFHTSVESHAESVLKEMKVDVRLHDIIYHAVDDVKVLMKGLLDKISKEEERGKAEVIAKFKSSHLGVIAGCRVTEGSISRNCLVRVHRGSEIVWKGPIASLKRVKEDVREVQKGIECGILLQGFNEVLEGDILEAYEVIYLEQDL